jgi:hypothetical protein
MKLVWSRRSRVTTALILLCLCALGNVRMLHRAWRKHLGSPQDACQRFVARFDALRPVLPAGRGAGLAHGPVGYLADGEHFHREPLHPDARFFLTQYAMSPCVVQRTTRRPLVIYDSDEPDKLPEIALREHWVLVADLRSGVKLFRTPVQE